MQLSHPTLASLALPGPDCLKWQSVAMTMADESPTRWMATFTFLTQLSKAQLETLVKQEQTAVKHDRQEVATSEAKMDRYQMPLTRSRTGTPIANTLARPRSKRDTCRRDTGGRLRFNKC